MRCFKRILLSSGICIAFVSATYGQAPFLFRLTNADARQAERTSVASIRESPIEVDVNALRAVGPEWLEFPLLDGRVYRAGNVRRDVRALDDFTVSASLRSGRFEGEAIFTLRKGWVSGLIYAPGGVYQIIPLKEGHRLVEIDQRLFPECGGEIPGGSATPSMADIDPAGGIDSGDRIDVLVVYTTAVKNRFGEPQAQVIAQQAIDAANGAYLNSKIRQRVRMVHTQEWVYTETTSGSTDLSNLRNDPNIQAARNTHNADLVAMIGEITGACGVGYLIGSSPSGNANNGFTVTDVDCAVGNLTLAHEMGHNMGSHHNPENGGTAIFPYGYGHYVNGVFRTVMSYVDPCPNGCTRRPYFSNPGVLYQGYPTGIENTRDNARLINTTADAIAGYRYSGKSLTLLNLNSAETIPRMQRRMVNWSSDNVTGDVRIELSRDQSTTWEVLVASTPNDGSEAINVYGRASRGSRIRVVSIDDPTISDTSVTNLFIR